MDSIAKRITRARLDLGINQKELAKKANITESSLSRYENGVREPKSAVLTRLADALEVSTDYLLGLTNEKNYDNYDMSLKSETDILDILQNVEQHLKSHPEGLTFCGKPASKEAIDGILYSIKAGILLGIEESKKK